MDSIDRVRELLDEYARLPRETGPVPLPEAYLRAIERIERLPKNQSGTDKSWVPALLARSAAFYARAVRKR